MLRLTQQHVEATPLDDSLVEIEKLHDKGIAIIWMNNPKSFNALTLDMSKVFQQKMGKLSTDKDVKCVVLSGRGKAFSSGGDLQFLLDRTKESAFDNAIIMREFYHSFLSIRNLPIPVISAINGAAVGAGLCLALATDIRIASKSAKMGFTFASLGIHPGMGASFFLPKLVGMQVASKLLLSGSTFTGEEAVRLGVVLEAVEEGVVLDKALEMAQSIASQSRLAVQGCIRTLRDAQINGLEDALWREASQQAQCYAGADLQEGIAAIKEKRKPNFQ